MVHVSDLSWHLRPFSVQTDVEETGVSSMSTILVIICMLASSNGICKQFVRITWGMGSRLYNYFYA